jgi:hypothetical protein
VQHKRSVGIKIGLSIRKVKRKPPRSKSLTNHEKENILLKRKRNNMTKVKCFNYGNKKYFSRDYREPKVFKDLMYL